MDTDTPIDWTQLALRVGRKAAGDAVAAVRLALRCGQLLAHPHDWKRQATPLWSRTGATVAFDAVLFAVLAVLGGALLSQAETVGGRLWAVVGWLALAVAWGAFSAADVRRLRTLRRRWLARAVEMTVPADVRPAPTEPTAPRVRSAYHPQQRVSNGPHSLWRHGGRSGA